jgi:hypothetical protein
MDTEKFAHITGPAAIVGPVLMYRDDMLSVMVAHGTEGQPGVIDEFILGRHLPDPPEWAFAADVVVTLRDGAHITMSEAQDTRAKIIEVLERKLRRVEIRDTDLQLADANAALFPSERADDIFRAISAERTTPPQGA